VDDNPGPDATEGYNEVPEKLLVDSWLVIGTVRATVGDGNGRISQSEVVCSGFEPLKSGGPLFLIF
jgi:hypothetical protein